MPERREEWDMNEAGGGAWEGETRRETCADRIRKAAHEAGDKARKIFKKGQS